MRLVIYDGLLHKRQLYIHMHVLGRLLKAVGYRTCMVITSQASLEAIPKFCRRFEGVVGSKTQGRAGV